MAMEEGIVDIKLVKVLTRCSKGKEGAKNDHFSYMGKSFGRVKTFPLIISFRHQASSIVLNGAIRVAFDFVYHLQPMSFFP